MKFISCESCYGIRYVSLFIISNLQPLPHDFGLGVELARGLIRTFDDETVFDDESLCTSNSRLVKNEDDLILNHSVSIPFILLNSGDECKSF
jgi:hypothetical protein